MTVNQTIDTAKVGDKASESRKAWRRPTLERLATDAAACMTPGSAGDAMGPIGDMKPTNCS
jgi:hypothetical protein